jgi:hypothetical protein
MRLGYFDRKTHESVSAVIANFNATDQRTVTEVSKFNWLWPCFEAKHCNTNANADTLDAFATGVDTTGLLAQDSYASAYRYFCERYGNHQDRLIALASSQNDRGVIGQGLTAFADPMQKTRALCRIVYRLRNNLFRGTKGQHGFVDQYENFLAANSLMRIWIEEPTI